MGESRAETVKKQKPLKKWSEGLISFHSFLTL
jgi:hypothetical protein